VLGGCVVKEVTEIQLRGMHHQEWVIIVRIESLLLLLS
jgi:hypothetical protein